MDTLEFLEAFHPGRLRMLTAISVDRKSIETRSFVPDEDAREWIQQYEGKRNLYFSVNVPRTQVGKKTKREDIAVVPWLHVDVDARVGEPFDTELERIRILLVEKCPIPPPTAVVFSGGGYQAFWRLKDPIVIDGDMNAAREAARYNRQLEVVLGGDNCSNIDRIMRLPGTMNLPDAKKAAKGRLPARADVVVFAPAHVYDLSEFAQAPALRSKDADPNVSPLHVGNVTRLSSINELDKWSVDDRTKVIIVQGRHPDEAPKPSRSEWLFDVVCHLVRANVPDEMIYNVLTDPDFKISESVLDKGVNADKYAARQIQRAKEEVEEPRLRMLNDRFVIVGDYGSKCVVVEELERRSDTLVSHVVQVRGEFGARFAHEHVQIGKRTFSLGQWWLTHPNARRRERVVFRPDGEAAPNDYNLWRGFAVEPMAGDCALFLDHVRENIAPDHWEWLLNWMARAVQSPGDQGEIAIVLRGSRGVGKSFFAREFGSLLGPHYLAISNPLHLVGHFNAHL